MASESAHVATTDNDPEQVFHFTSMDAMMGIVKTQSLWCTALPYLNDSAERRFLLNAVKARLPQLKQKDSSLDQSLDIAPVNVHEGGFLTSLAHEAFVASFAEFGDSLMHWRSYCPQQSGVAIGFRTDHLAEAQIDEKPQPGMMIPPVGFGKIRYIDIGSTKVLDEVIYEQWHRLRQCRQKKQRG